MSNFRNTADILDEILEKAGESSAGQSPYESRVLRFTNKVHLAIIGGGNVFDINVDENWNWARSRHPFVIDLMPAYITGTVSMVEGDINFSFSDAPDDSLEGWFLQVQGYNTVYRITEHTAGDAAAVIDSAFVDPGGNYIFRAIKLEYELVPQYIYVGSHSDKVDFSEVDGTQITATLDHGSYTPAELAAAMATKMTAASTGSVTYTSSYDSVLRQITLTSNLAGGKIFTLLGATGTNKRRTALPLAGFDRLDASGASNYTSAYIINGICRLIEPFRVFTGRNNAHDPHINASDPVKMENKYPTAFIQEQVPEEFCKISETFDGTYVVRFNSYPGRRTKVLVDWIPMPIDLQDNTSSVPLIPRDDVDVLINAAAMYIAYDKSDDKFQTLSAMVRAQLESMKKKFYSEIYKTGPKSGQIIPRADLEDRQRRLNYGYTAAGANVSRTAEQPQSMVQVPLSFSSFTDGSLQKAVVARTLPQNRALFSLILKLNTTWAGSGISSLVMDVGTVADPTRFIQSFNLLQAASDSAQDSNLLLFSPFAATGIQVRVTAVGANLTALSAGAVTLYFSEQLVTS